MLQPLGIITLAHESHEQTNRHPFMAVVVPLAWTWILESILKGVGGLAKVMDQGR